MAGRKTFNPDDVLDKALILFWDRGYQAASYSALKEMTGLEKSSLRNAFGDKRSLFEACIRHYEHNHYNPALSQLERAGLPEVIQEHFEGLFERFAESNVRKGSLAALHVMASGNYSEEKGSFMKEQLDRLYDLFTRRFEQAVKEEELPPNTDVDALASTMLVLSRSLAAMFRETDDIDHLRRTVRTFTAVLGNPPTI